MTGRGSGAPPVNSEAIRLLLTSTFDQYVLLATRPEYAAMVWIGAVLGLRWGEVAGLRVGSIDFLRGHLVVSETSVRRRG